MRNISLIAWSMLIIAVIAMAGAVYFFLTVQTVEHDQALYAARSLQSAQRHTDAVRAHALLESTQNERSQLSGLLNTDIVSMADLIQGAGKNAGIEIKLGDATPQSGSSDDTLKAIGFNLEADGSFAAIMRAVTLLESLPLPSSIDQLDIERSPDQTDMPKGLWHMNATIRILTTLNTSS